MNEKSTRNNSKKKFMRFLQNEIWIEYKACLYAYILLVFYCTYQIIQKTYSASILHMAEMFCLAYIMGYVQVYLLGDFDDVDKLRWKQIAAMILCSGIYTLASYLFGWFGRSILVTVIYASFMLFAYWCVYLINLARRARDTRNLNQMLTEFKQEKIREEEQ